MLKPEGVADLVMTGRIVRRDEDLDDATLRAIAEADVPTGCDYLDDEPGHRQGAACRRCTPVSPHPALDRQRPGGIMFPTGAASAIDTAPEQRRSLSLAGAAPRPFAARTDFGAAWRQLCEQLSFKNMQRRACTGR